MIGFLHPWALLGLLAAGIPILLHLLARREPPTVVFPAVRYLITTTKEHQRRLKLQNLLLLVVRTLLDRPAGARRGGSDDAAPRRAGTRAERAGARSWTTLPAARAVVAGSARLGHLASAARQVLGRATPDDALWLITADGVPQRGDAGALTEHAARRSTSRPRRLDLGAALTLAGEILAPEPKPGEIVLLSDLQASAVSPAERERAAARRPSGGCAAAQRRSRPARDRHAAVVFRRRPRRRRRWRATPGLPCRSPTRIGQRPAAPGARPRGRRGDARRYRASPRDGGRWTADLAPDEFRLDDRRLGVVRVAPVARVAWDTSSRYVVAACEVLAVEPAGSTGGNEVTFGRLGSRCFHRAASRRSRPRSARSIGRSRRGASPGATARSSLQAAMTDSGPVPGPRPGARGAITSNPPAAGAPVCSPPSAGRRGWCEAETCCCWAAASTRRGPSCRCRPASCPSWMR